MMNSKNGTKPWEKHVFPVIPKTKAFVLPGAFYGQCVLLMTAAGYSRADSVDEADVVVFIGGADINPALYGHKNVASGFNDQRDAYEVSVYEEAVKKKKVLFGICRGAQFLHAMNGGTLWQDVNGHAGHPHEIVDLDEDVTVMATSLHHQMLQDNDTLEVLAVTNKQVATRFRDADMVMEITKAGVDSDDSEIEIEAGCYHATKSFFVQGHPEVGSVFYQTWTMTKLYDLMNEWRSAEELKNVVTKMEIN